VVNIGSTCNYPSKEDSDRLNIHRDTHPHYLFVCLLSLSICLSLSLSPSIYLSPSNLDQWSLHCPDHTYTYTHTHTLAHVYTHTHMVRRLVLLANTKHSLLYLHVRSQSLSVGGVSGLSHSASRVKSSCHTMTSAHQFGELLHRFLGLKQKVLCSRERTYVCVCMFVYMYVCVCMCIRG
jgi:hypothetical protein